VRENAHSAFDGVDEWPTVLDGRLLSLRAYDVNDLIVEADVAQGVAAKDAIERFFARDDVRYIHIHNAKRGCYSCRVDRA
jgi:hypothetical protein